MVDCDPAIVFAEQAFGLALSDVVFWWSKRSPCLFLHVMLLNLRHVDMQVVRFGVFSLVTVQCRTMPAFLLNISLHRWKYLVRLLKLRLVLTHVELGFEDATTHWLRRRSSAKIRAVKSANVRIGDVGRGFRLLDKFLLRLGHRINRFERGLG